MVAAGTEGAANRQVTAALRGSGEYQGGDIGTSDQQEGGDRALEDQEGRPYAAHPNVAQG